MTSRVKAAHRPPRPTHHLEVLETGWLNPQLVRIRLGGPGFATFEDRPETDKYVKLRLTDADGDEVTRTYTVRQVDPQARALDIDFVVHGDAGLSGPWAARAKPGDALTLVGPGGGYRPDPEADWYLMAGDLAALPAIAASLAELPADAVGTALIEVTAADAKVALDTPPGMEIRWLIDPGHAADRLADEVRELRWPAGRVDVFAHGERESMKALRRVLCDERALDRKHMSLSGYWARGRIEDQFQAEKRTPIGQIFPEA
ncbi:MAG: siderophore-interacting protein [Arachnia sp.]